MRNDDRFARRAFVFAACAASLITLGVAAPSPAIPAGTRVRFHLVETVSSNHSRTGDAFRFVLLAPLSADGTTIALEGATGSGTVFLAGASGSLGHEGDLTLRIESLPTVDGRYITFDDQRFQMNGRNRKLASAVLGFVPYAGLGARFIRGSDVRVDPATPIETVLLHPATIAATILPQPVPVPTPATKSPSSSPSPSQSTTPLPAMPVSTTPLPATPLPALSPTATQRATPTPTPSPA